MPRARNRVASRRRRKKILNMAKGYWGSRSKIYTIAKNAVEKGLQYAYRDRRQRKRDMRGLWITRITAACRMRGTRYSLFMSGLKVSGILLNRKMLSQLAIEEPQVFDGLVKTAVAASKASVRVAS